MNSHRFKHHRPSICQMLGKSSGVESERTVSKFRRRKKILFLCSPTSIKRAREIKNSCRSCATKAKKCAKRCVARAKLLFCQSKPIAFLPFLLPLPSSLLELPIDLFCLYVFFLIEVPGELDSLSLHKLCADMHVKKTKFERNNSLECYYRTRIWKTKLTYKLKRSIVVIQKFCYHDNETS